MVPSYWKEPYNKVNLLLAGVIIAIFIYSGIFSTEKDNHPVSSFYPEAMSKESPTKGLSRSFSEIIRGHFKEARQWNEYGIPVFFFFFTQLILRLVLNFFHYKRICVRSTYRQKIIHKFKPFPLNLIRKLHP